MINLDYAATTSVKQEVFETIKKTMETYWHNPSALYRNAKMSKKEIDSARKVVADYINAKPEEIIFTSSGSESNSLAIQGFCKQVLSKGRKPVVITTAIEHKSIIECVECSVENFIYVGVDEVGTVNLYELENVLKKESENNNTDILVSVQWANNEIGTVQPMKEVSLLTHKYNAVLHTDAVQAFAYLKIDTSLVDMMSVSGHKIGCPKGIAFLYKKECVDIKPIIYGSQEFGLRGGTENIPYIVGLKKAIELMPADMNEYYYDLYDLNNIFVRKLGDKLGVKDCKLGKIKSINGSMMPMRRLPNNINITFNCNLTGEALIYMMNTARFEIASGSACSSHTVSHVLKAIGLSEEDALKTIRISFAEDILEEDMNKFVDELDKAIKILTE